MVALHVLFLIILREFTTATIFRLCHLFRFIDRGHFLWSQEMGIVPNPKMQRTDFRFLVRQLCTTLAAYINGIFLSRSGCFCFCLVHVSCSCNRPHFTETSEQSATSSHHGSLGADSVNSIASDQDISAAAGAGDDLLSPKRKTEQPGQDSEKAPAAVAWMVGPNGIYVLLASQLLLYSASAFVLSTRQLETADSHFH